MQEYVPGVCNIGNSEIKRREQAGWAGLMLTAILLVLFVYLDVPRLLRLVIFIPVAISVLGFLQARMRFCAYFGIKGVFNFGELGETYIIEQPEFRAKDFKKARQIIMYSIIAGIIAAAVAYYL